MNFQQLEYFIELAKSQHMTNTAKKLNITQPNLSYTISELEKEVGVPLFKKVGRNIRLTKYGNIYYEHAQKALQTIQAANDLITQDIQPYSGNIRLGFIYTQGADNAPNLISTFSKTYPDASFSITQNTSKNLLTKLEKDELDIVMSSHVTGFDQVTFTPLLMEKLTLIVPLEHPLASRDEVTLEEASHYDFVYYNQNSGLRPYLDELLKKAELDIAVAIEMEDDQSVLGFVSHDFGIAIMPDIPSISAYPVKKIAISDLKLPRLIYLATQKKDYLSPTVQLFKDFCLDYFNLSKELSQKQD